MQASSVSTVCPNNRHQCFGCWWEISRFRPINAYKAQKIYVGTSVPKRPGPASILKACAKGGPARPGSEAAWPGARPPRKAAKKSRPAAKKKPAGLAGKTCRPGVAGKSVSHHHSHSAWQRTERWRVYGDTGMTEVDWATGSIYLREIDIISSYYHTTKYTIYLSQLLISLAPSEISWIHTAG